MPISLSEAVQTLLSGNALTWKKFGDIKAGQVQSKSPEVRRLLHYLLSCEKNKVAEASEQLFPGLIAAWKNILFDPADKVTAAESSAAYGRWRLTRIEAAAFGGLDFIDGPNFVLALNGENWCLEGQNGSGKTSIASAVIWALTGRRCRDQDGLVQDDGHRGPVFNDSGVQIGDWPPTVAYPATVLKLGGTAETWVRLTFQNEDGDKAEAFRRLTAPPAGDPQFESQIDAALQSTPQLIETGLLMPARLARIGFGVKSQSIYEAVKLLTGLDQLADIGEGAANFSHKAKRFLKYASDNGIQTIEAKLGSALERAAEESKKADFELRIASKREDDGYVKELRDLADRAWQFATTHSSVLASDVASDIDTAKPEDRAKIRVAVSAARGILQQGVRGIGVFEAWAALKTAHADPAFSKLPKLLMAAKSKVAQAITWDQAAFEC